MSEKGLFGGIERFSHSLIELAVGIGSIALGFRFFKESFNSSKKKKKKAQEN